ncbi:MAG TPA: lasso peptide biosynthesis B2 protein [Cyanobacteria bacterium UBA8803]|nr:lasso peptide biosynthesis B2 protein [Cyanobacteria bacterium UBA9273]HBL60478.1 lasso peptide biosynthesis B2 protein [Cyanobacteria bacterium UBA8803]
MKRLGTFLSLTTSDRILLIEAGILLAGIRLGLWLLPFNILYQLVSRITSATTKLQEVNQTSINKVSWAVVTVSRYMPGVKCLARALTTQILLSWYGQSAHLCIGVAKGESGKLEAHAWVESQGKIAIGNLPDLSRYTLLPSLRS